jgi:hypothetical protein
MQGAGKTFASGFFCLTCPLHPVSCPLPTNIDTLPPSNYASGSFVPDFEPADCGRA